MKWGVASGTVVGTNRRGGYASTPTTHSAAHTRAKLEAHSLTL